MRFISHDCREILNYQIESDIEHRDTKPATILQRFISIKQITSEPSSNGERDN